MKKSDSLVKSPQFALGAYANMRRPRSPKGLGFPGNPIGNPGILASLDSFKGNIGIAEGLFLIIV